MNLPALRWEDKAVKTIQTRAFINGEWLDVLEINTSTKRAKVMTMDGKIDLIRVSDVIIWDQKEVRHNEKGKIKTSPLKEIVKHLKHNK